MPAAAESGRGRPVCPRHHRIPVMVRRTSRPLLLVLRGQGLAGFLTAIPAFRALAETFPRHKRVLATSGSLGSIVRLCGWFDQLLPVESPMRLPAMQRPDIAVDLDGDPDASRSLLALRPRSLIAFQRDDVPPVVLPGPRYRPDEP